MSKQPNTQQKKVRQHFVPQFLLRNFADQDDRFFVYDKKTGDSFPRRISKVGFSKLFYDDAEIDKTAGEFQFIENALAKLESRWNATLNEVLKKVRSSSSPNITQQERTDICQMIAVQMMRTPLTRETFGQMNQEMRKVVENRATELGLTEFPKEFMDFDEKKFHLASMLRIENLESYMAMFNGHIWNFLRAGNHGDFYISDHPLGKRPHITEGWMSHSGIGSPGIEISFPLANDVVLIMYEQSFFRGKVFPNHTTVTAIAPEMILYHNCFQTKTSQRFIYSKSNDFGHAELICRDEPNLRNPDRPMVEVA